MANNITSKIPNTITCCNLLCGCIAVVLALKNQPIYAFSFVFLGAVFDFFDGMTARLLGVQSAIGRELDSLADVITFGFAPSAMLFSMLNTVIYPEFLVPLKDIFPYTAFLITAFSALRLANFNVDTRQLSSFIGLPTPANALFWGSYIIYFKEINSVLTSPILLFVLTLASCWILNAEIPMFALKFKHWNWSENKTRYVFILSCIPLIILFKSGAFAIIIAWYVLLSAVTRRAK